jgi:hypothetical protein
LVVCLQVLENKARRHPVKKGHGQLQELSQKPLQDKLASIRSSRQQRQILPQHAKEGFKRTRPGPGNQHQYASSVFFEGAIGESLDPTSKVNINGVAKDSVLPMRAARAMSRK